MVRLLAGLVFLFLLFLPAPPTIGRLPVLDHHIPLEVLIISGALAILPLAGRRLPRVLRWLLAVLVLLVAILHLVDAEGPPLMGRDLDLAADLRHVTSVFSLFAGAASPWQIIAGIVGGIALPLILIALTAWALGAIEVGFADRRRAGAALVICVLGLVLARSPIVSTNSFAALKHQTRAVMDDWRASHGEHDAFVKALGPAPRTDADLKGLAGNDVYLIFFESYGAVLLDDPTLRATAAPALEQFGTTLAQAGFTLRTARIASPTYGGGSWLAHGTVDSGTWLNSQLRYTLQTTTDRPTWPRLMKQAGYATTDAMPGLKTPLDSAAYWGFDRMIGTDAFGYEGPSFGWFGLPDQFSLGVVEHLPREPQKPRFIQIVLLSSHLPFAPVPPYVEDWSDAGTFASHPEVKHLAPPDWGNLAEPYGKSVVYDLKTLENWIPRAVQGNGLVIILGDHQPPALIGAASASHDVPIHILSRDGDLVRRLADKGFADGPFPGGSTGTMAELLPRFLDAYSSPHS
ncbi:MAG TPA: sulfatase-like hydrolase/transferase [Aliidongia sp.]|nr:sulfatase-like hydrolase/transferase [Aliidongia sp.]